MEQPNVPKALAGAKAQGLRSDVMSTSYFLNRRSLRVGKARLMPLWASRLYAGMYRSASEPTNFIGCRRTGSSNWANRSISDRG